VKDKVSILIYLMINNFKQVAGAINANPQIGILVALPLCGAVIAVILKGVENIFPADVMFERSFVKLDNYLLIHILILPQKRCWSKTHALTAAIQSIDRLGHLPGRGSLRRLRGRCRRVTGTLRALNVEQGQCEATRTLTTNHNEPHKPTRTALFTVGIPAGCTMRFLPGLESPI
jgi:hypothetical protein